ncbi:MAG: YidC/Oxa1 family membrane protein insertase [bacterium]|nr:YidC/Oxa1 family membrane protein insertase [bacterium]MDZ4247746.1 YidC/Oxa1 family membrane protein insertase [Patescibacteria group bacterium]
MEILKTIFFDPIFNALIALYNVTGDFGIAIILVTLLVRVAVGPFSAKAFKAQRRMQALQPELKKLQEKHKDDREALAKEMMTFYKQEGINPASSCLPTLVQIPFLIVLFFSIKDIIAGKAFDHLYSFVANPGTVDPSFLGLLDLSTIGLEPSNIILGVATALVMFWQSRMLTPKGVDMPGMSRNMMLLFPVLTLVFSVTLPAALPLYWASSTAFTIAQQYYIIQRMPLATAKAEARQDWNVINPEDPVDGNGKSAAKPGKQKAIKGATVTVRKRSGK